MQGPKDLSRGVPSEKPVAEATFFIDSVDMVSNDPTEAGYLTGRAIALSPATSRKILFRPAFPRYPEWELLETRGRSAKFRVFVSPQGLIEQIVAVQTTNNPEIDAVLARYVSKWRFEVQTDQAGQWQVVTVELDK